MKTLCQRQSWNVRCKYFLKSYNRFDFFFNIFYLGYEIWPFVFRKHVMLANVRNTEMTFQPTQNMILGCSWRLELLINPLWIEFTIFMIITWDMRADYSFYFYFYCRNLTIRSQPAITNHLRDGSITSWWTIFCFEG
jgi:hypothetical protein